jgi:hypothetical protein
MNISSNIIRQVIPSLGGPTLSQTALGALRRAALARQMTTVIYLTPDKETPAPPQLQAQLADIGLKLVAQPLTHVLPLYAAMGRCAGFLLPDEDAYTLACTISMTRAGLASLANIAEIGVLVTQGHANELVPEILGFGVPRLTEELPLKTHVDRVELRLRYNFGQIEDTDSPSLKLCASALLPASLTHESKPSDKSALALVGTE